jgi:hypothetical protein
MKITASEHATPMLARGLAPLSLKYPPAKQPEGYEVCFKVTRPFAEAAFVNQLNTLHNKKQLRHTVLNPAPYYPQDLNPRQRYVCLYMGVHLPDPVTRYWLFLRDLLVLQPLMDSVGLVLSHYRRYSHRGAFMPPANQSKEETP